MGMGFEEAYEFVTNDLPMIDVCRLVRRQYLEYPWDESRGEGRCDECPLRKVEECWVGEEECEEIGRGALRRLLKEMESRLAAENGGNAPADTEEIIRNSIKNSGVEAAKFAEEIRRMMQEIAKGGE